MHLEKLIRKKFRVATTVLIFGGLQCNAVDRAGYRTEVATNAAFATIRILVNTMRPL
jgi:hypothetical protein